VCQRVFPGPKSLDAPEPLKKLKDLRSALLVTHQNDVLREEDKAYCRKLMHQA
jgi:hypothetical protein